MKSVMQPAARAALFEYLLRLGDDRLVLGHRLSEWCGHAPILEEDIALGNIALDCLGQAAALLRLAGEVEDKGRDEDDLTYFREAIDFRCSLLVEQPNGDFAVTMARQFLVDAFNFHLYKRLKESEFAPLAAVAAKAYKEICYHLRHSREWMIRLGDGTSESRRRSEAALQQLWRFTGDLFAAPDSEAVLVKAGIAPDRQRLKPKWRETVTAALGEAKLETPEFHHMVIGGFQGLHTEHLGHLLAEMQILARSHPGAEW